MIGGLFGNAFVTPAPRGLLADVRAGRAVHKCLGRGKVEKLYAGYRCAACSSIWYASTLDRFSLAELEDRFAAAPRPTGDACVLVWVTEGKNRFVKSVPLFEAEGMERVEL